MAKSPRKTNTNAISNAILDCMAPLVALLDRDYNDASTGIKAMGHAQPSTQDMGIKITMDSITAQVYRQVYGSISSSTGTRFDNLKERFEKAQMWMLDHSDKYAKNPEGLIDDPRTWELQQRLELAETKYNCFAELCTQFEIVFQALVGTDWEYIDRSKPAAPAKKPVRQMTDAERKAAIAKIEALRQANPAPVTNKATADETAALIAAAVGAGEHVTA